MLNVRDPLLLIPLFPHGVRVIFPFYKPLKLFVIYKPVANARKRFPLYMTIGSGRTADTIRCVATSCMKMVDTLTCLTCPVRHADRFFPRPTVNTDISFSSFIFDCRDEKGRGGNIDRERP